MFKKSTPSDWLKVLVLLLDEAVVLVLIFVALHFFDIHIPLAITIFLVLLISVFIFVVHIKVIPSFHWKQVTGQEGMIGLQGKVVEPLTPTGTIIVKGERWKAKSVDNVEIGENVEVVEVEGLTLMVIQL
ncbi:NfeD family protein [Chloroflexota bacterium]